MESFGYSNIIFLKMLMGHVLNDITLYIFQYQVYLLSPCCFLSINCLVYIVYCKHLSAKDTGIQFQKLLVLKYFKHRTLVEKSNDLKCNIRFLCTNFVVC